MLYVFGIGVDILIAGFDEHGRDHINPGEGTTDMQTAKYKM